MYATFSHSTSHCEAKNTLVDPNQLNLTPLLHFSVLMCIRIGNEPTSTICSELSQSNSNVAKVSIKKWSKTLIWVYGNGVLGIPKYLTNACKARYLTIFWYAQNTASANPNQIPRPHNNRYFCHTTVVKWSQSCFRTFRK